MATLHNVLTPVERTRTQTAPGTGFNERNGTHWGEDLRPAVQGKAGDPIYAPAKARVVATGYGKGEVSDRIPYHSGRFVLLDLGTWGGDRMYMYAGHLASTAVSTGQQVRAGHIIGTMGGSGANGENHFVAHLHLGISVNTDRPTGVFKRGKGWTDPVKWFARHGVNLNTTPTAQNIIPASTGGLTVSDINTILTRLAAIDDRLKAHDGNSWNQRRSTAAEIAELSDSLGGQVWSYRGPNATRDAYGYLRETNRNLATLKGEQAGLIEAIKQLATGVDIDLEAVAEAAREGAREGASEGLAEGVELDATVTIKKEG